MSPCSTSLSNKSSIQEASYDCLKILHGSHTRCPTTLLNQAAHMSRPEFPVPRNIRRNVKGDPSVNLSSKIGINLACSTALLRQKVAVVARHGISLIITDLMVHPEDIGQLLPRLDMLVRLVVYVRGRGGDGLVPHHTYTSGSEWERDCSSASLSGRCRPTLCTVGKKYLYRDGLKYASQVL